MRVNRDQFLEDLTHRFTLPKIEILIERFAPLELKLQFEDRHRDKAFTRLRRYREYEMPADYSLNDFIDSWTHKVAIG